MVDFGIPLILLVVIFVIPVSVLMGGAILSALVGWALKARTDEAHEGSELVELNT